MDKVGDIKICNHCFGEKQINGEACGMCEACGSLKYFNTTFGIPIWAPEHYTDEALDKKMKNDLGILEETFIPKN